VLSARHKLNFYMLFKKFVLQVMNFFHKNLFLIMKIAARSVCYGKEDGSSSVSGVDRYMIIRKLFGSTFNVLPVFIYRCEIRIYCHVYGFDYRRVLYW
jgi:hypothetical protein